MAAFAKGGWCCLAWLPFAAYSAEWSAEPRLTTGVSTDSNPRLVEPPEGAQAVRIEGSLALSRKSATGNLEIRPRLEVRRFDAANTVLDSNDAGADIVWQWQRERAAWRLDGSAREDGTLTSELADTGIVEGRARRRLLTASADTHYQWGLRTRLSAGASLMDVDFDDAGGTGLTAYRYPSAFLGISRENSDRSRVSLSASAGRLELPISGTRTENAALRASWQTQITERLGVELSGGVNQVRNELGSDQGAVFGVTGQWSGVRSSLGISLARDVEPSGLGRMMNVDSIAASWRWQTSERSWISLALRHLRRADLLFGLFPERRDYSTAQAAYNWRMDDQWTLELRAAAARQAFELLDYEAEGERLELQLVWAPRRLSWTR